MLSNDSFLPSIVKGMGYDDKLSANLMSGTSNVVYTNNSMIYTSFTIAPPYVGAVFVVSDHNVHSILCPTFCIDGRWCLFL